MENYYEILEVDVKASKEVIDKAFRVLAKRYHPDTQPDDKKEWAEEMFKKINEAYEVLSDEEARKNYDIELDYDKNSAIQAICAKNEHLERLVKKLQDELSYLKSHPSNSTSESNIHQNYARPQNTNAYEYQHQNPRTQNFNAYYSRPVQPEETVYYETQVPYSRNRLKDLLAFIITILCIIGIGFLLWKIPFTQQFLVKLYEDNPPIKVIVDFFLNLFS